MALIRSVADRYDRIVAHYRTMSEPFGALCQALDGKMLAVQADLADRSAIDRMIKTICEMDLPPDHMVHLAAAPFVHTHFRKLSVETAERSMQIGCYALWQLSGAFVPKMAKKETGKLVVMLSGSVVHTPPYCSEYVVTKYAMLGLVKALAAEYSGSGVEINAVSPGHVQTKFLKEHSPIIREKYKEQSPGGRLLQAEEVARVIGTLLSDSFRHVTGQNICISG